MEPILEKIGANTASKASQQILVSSNKTKFTTTFNAKIEFDENKQYEIALVNLETYYSFPNITRNNNSFIYSLDAGYSWVKIAISEGSYDQADLNDVILRELRKNGNWDSINEEYPITLYANTNTLKAVLILEDNFWVDFNHPNSLSKVLGFNRAKYETGFHESENIVNIIDIYSILVNTNHISRSYVNGNRQNTIYSFFPQRKPRVQNSGNSF